MNCRHCKAEWTADWEYCPECHRNYGGALYPATQTPEELADIDSLIDMIRRAFADVQLEEGVTIHEADLEGVYREEQVRLDARAKDPETDWRDVPDWKIERFELALCFFDAKGWRFYIPAYMCWTLKNWRTTDSITADSVIWNLEPSTGCPDWSLSRYGALSEQQGTAVFAFLDFFRRYSGLPDANRAIEAYWHRFEKVTS